MRADDARSSGPHLLRAGFALALLLVASGPGAAQNAPEIGAEALRLDYSWDEHLRLVAESFELSAELPTELATLESRTVVRGFPTAPGERSDVVFDRVDLYSPTARIFEIGDFGERELPRSSRVHLLGTALADPRVRVGLSLDPLGARLSGVLSTPTGAWELRELQGEPATGRRFEIGTAVDERLGIQTHAVCETPDTPQPLDLREQPGGPQPPPPLSSSHTHEAVVAFDTDGEFLADYGNDTGAANDAIGDFLLSVNVIYERDLGLRLLQGDTVLRTDAAGDPYVSSSTRTQLDEVGDWWEANKSGVERVWVALLSGKGFSSGGSCSGAGIAWIDQYCDEVVSGGAFDGGSYSATQVLRCVSLGGSSNTNLIGHEIGHNAGSRHTHCYSPEVDQCYNAQSGCYSGTPSCPDFSGIIPGIQAGRGTIMSYCHFGAPSGAACGSNQPYFHPTVVGNIQESIDANTPSCVQLAAGADLSIEKSDSEDPIGRGAGLTYQVTVTNLGPIDATAVEVTEALPAGVSLVSTSGCAEDPAGVPTCTLGDVPVGESRQLEVSVLVLDSAPGSITNEVTVSAATSDPEPGNDAALETTAVVSWPCQASSYNLTAADNTAPGPFVTEGSITAGSGYTVESDETIGFRPAGDVVLRDGFSAAGGLSVIHDPLLDCQ
jgi:uncharacterized repeat protein (TIGR01451 family)